MFSTETDGLYRTWNVTIANFFKLDRKTHRYLIEPISNTFHLKTALLARYVNFFKMLRHSPKFSIRYLVRIVSEDKSTVMGKTLHALAKNANLEEISDLTPQLVKNTLRYFPVPEDEDWRIQICSEIMSICKNNNDIEIPGFDMHEINDMLKFICSN